MSSASVVAPQHKSTHGGSLLAVAGVEWRKAVRSPIFLITVIFMIFVPMMLGLLMFIKKYPELAQSSIILAKANAIPGSGDWASYFEIFAQIISGAGLVVFGFVTSWLFGREYSDRTVKDLLALPLPRSSLVYGKFMVMACWCGVLFAVASIVMLGIGLGLQLSDWSTDVWLHSMRLLGAVTLMNIGLCMLTGFVASWTRGYIAPIGFVIVTLVLANFVSMLGLGTYYPWGIPMLYAMQGMAGASLGLVSVAIVIATSAAGLLSTLAWWRFADQH